MRIPRVELAPTHDHLLAIGPEAWLEAQLNPDTIPDPGSITIHPYRAGRQHTREYALRRIGNIKKLTDPTQPGHRTPTTWNDVERWAAGGVLHVEGSRDLAIARVVADAVGHDSAAHASEIFDLATLLDSHGRQPVSEEPPF